MSNRSETLSLSSLSSLREKEQNLRTIIRKLKSTVIAYSGGVDSTVVAKVAHEELGENALLVIADSPSLPRSELADAMVLADAHHLPIKVVSTAELTLPAYQANPTNRCYYCKDTLYRKLAPFLANANTNNTNTKAEDRVETGNKTFKVILNGDHYEDSYGENFTHRPGALAAKEHGIHSPLRSARFTKTDIRALAKKLGLPNAEKPASPCLSSRIPTGSMVTERKLSQIEQAEAILRTCINQSGGSSNPILRVRHLEQFAKIEVVDSERAIIRTYAEQIAEAFRKIGFGKVYLSKNPFTSGSVSGKKNKYALKDLIADSEELTTE